MNEKFRTCLTECKQLNSAGLLHQTGATADKILYNHAIQMVSTRYIPFVFIRRLNPRVYLRANTFLFTSVSQRRSTSCLAIPPNVSSGITRHRYCCILYHSMSVTVKIEPSLLNVICFFFQQTPLTLLFFRLECFLSRIQCAERYRQ